MASKRGSHAFTARVQAVSMGVPFYVVPVPAAVSAALGEGRVHVVGTVNGASLKTSLKPLARGGHELFLNRRVREAANVGPGDRVKVVLALAAAPNEEPIPDDLALALRDADVLGPWQRIARSTRNELIRWIDDAKTEPTRDKRIQRAVERALAAHEKEIRPPALDHVGGAVGRCEARAAGAAGGGVGGALVGAPRLHRAEAPEHGCRGGALAPVAGEALEGAEARLGAELPAHDGEVDAIVEVAHRGVSTEASTARRTATSSSGSL